MSMLNNKRQVAGHLLGWLLLSSLAHGEEINRPDLPPPTQVETALHNHLLVLNATSSLQQEQANQRKWNSGSYEFSLRAGASRRHIVNTGQQLKEWDVALERPVRLFNKVSLDQDIGAASVARAEFALGDAHHEAGRSLLHLWFTWQKEYAQMQLWQQQVAILKQQATMTDKRVQAGDAPRLELNQAQAAAAQAAVSLQQVALRTQLARYDLTREFSSIQLPETPSPAVPQAIEHDYAYWQTRILADNHELGMVQAHSQVQALLAQRSRAEQIPDPTLGMRYANEMGGNEKVAGIYVSVPLSFGQRSATADGVAQQAIIAADQATFVQRRLESDIQAAYSQATSSYHTWQQAQQAAQAIRNNAELVSKAYRLGESSLSDSLTAQRMAQEASLSETLAQLDANEARYRLLLDAHQLWSADSHDDH